MPSNPPYNDDWNEPVASSVLRKQTPYAVLLVKSSDADDVIRHAYWAIAQLKNHPDVNGGIPGPRWHEATDAYNLIKTKTLRDRWDLVRQLEARFCKECDGYGVRGSRIGKGRIRICEQCLGVGKKERR